MTRDCHGYTFLEIKMFLFELLFRFFTFMRSAEFKTLTLQNLMLSGCDYAMHIVYLSFVRKSKPLGNAWSFGRRGFLSNVYAQRTQTKLLTHIFN